MTFRDRMRVNPSQAEIDVFTELQRRGLHKHLVSLGTVVLIMKATEERRVIIANKNQVTKPLVSLAEMFTIPDFPFLRHHRLLVYLDGPVHERRGVKNRDDRIDKQLTKFGFQSERFSYTPPLSNTRKMEICNRLAELLQ